MAWLGIRRSSESQRCSEDRPSWVRRYPGSMSSHAIRIYGDPVLRTRSADVTEIDGRLHTLAESMFDTMYEAPGLGLAAPQVGVRKRLFVYDFGDGPQTMVNPEILE